jgi:hypothetical protein
MWFLAEGAVMGVAAAGFCLMLVAFGMIIRRGGWQPAMQLTAEGRWPLPRRFLLTGAALGAVSGLLMFLLGLIRR